MAKEAERLLVDSGWLPEPLRPVDAGAEVIGEQADQDAGDEALPAFLSDDGDDEELAEDDEALLAAE